MTTNVSGWQTVFLDLFIDPISHELMQQPMSVIPCGHTFERDEINGWIASRIQAQAAPQCPLCRGEIRELIRALLLEQALAVLRDPANQALNNVVQLTDEEQEQLQRAAAQTQGQREQDAQRGIPDRLAEPQSFGQRIKTASGRVYSC